MHELCLWISAMTKEDITSFRESLVSGRLLCKLLAQAMPRGTDLRKFHRRDGGLLELYLRLVVGGTQYHGAFTPISS